MKEGEVRGSKEKKCKVMGRREGREITGVRNKGKNKEDKGGTGRNGK